jgi:hypothetical protein
MEAKLLVAFVCGLLAVLPAGALAKGKKPPFVFGQSNTPQATVKAVTTGPYLPGQPVTFQATATVPYGQVIIDASICISPPAYVTSGGEGPFDFVSATPSATSVTGNGVACFDLGDIGPGVSTSVVTVTYQVSEAAGDFNNTLAVGTVSLLSGTDPLAAGDFPADITPVGLSVGSSTGSAAVAGGDTLTLDTELTNLSQQAIPTTGGQVCAALPKEYFAAGPPVCSPVSFSGFFQPGATTQGQIAINTSGASAMGGPPALISTTGTFFSTGVNLVSPPVGLPVKVIPQGPAPTAAQSFSPAPPFFQGQKIASEVSLNPNGGSVQLTGTSACQTYDPAVLEFVPGSGTTSAGPGRACAAVKPTEANPSQLSFNYQVQDDAPYGSFQVKASAEAGQTAEVEAPALSGSVAAGGPQVSAVITSTSVAPDPTKGLLDQDPVTFDLDVINTGIGPLSGVQACVNLPDNLQYDSATPAPTNTPQHNQPVCFAVGTLQPGAKSTIDLDTEVFNLSNQQEEDGFPVSVPLTVSADQTEDASDGAYISLGFEGTSAQVGFENNIVSSAPFSPGETALVHFSIIGGTGHEYSYDACLGYPEGVISLTTSDPSPLAGTASGEWCAGNNPQNLPAGQQGGGLLEFQIPVTSGPGVIASTMETEDLIGVIDLPPQTYSPITEQGPSVVAQSTPKQIPPGPYDQNDKMAFNLLVANSGTEPLTNVQVCDDFSSDLSISGSSGSDICYPAQGDPPIDLDVGEVQEIEQEFTVESAPTQATPGSNILTASADQVEQPFTDDQNYVLGNGSFGLSSQLVDSQGDPVSSDEITPGADYAVETTVSNASAADISDLQVCVSNESNVIPGAINTVPVNTSLYEGAFPTSTGTSRCFTAYEVVAGQTVSYDFNFEGVYPSPPGNYDFTVTATEPATSTTMTDTVDYEIVPVPVLTTEVAPKLSPDFDYAGGQIPFTLTVENSSQATAAAEDVTACLDLSNTKIGFESNDSSGSLSVNGQGEPCLNPSSIAIGGQASAKAEYEIPYEKGLGSQAGKATFCATATNGYDENGANCSSAPYSFDTQGNPSVSAGGQSISIRGEVSKKRVGSGHHLRYKLFADNVFFDSAIGPEAPVPLFAPRICHLIPEGLALDGSNHPRRELTISRRGHKICLPGSELPERAGAKLQLRYLVKRDAPRKIRAHAQLKAPVLGSSGGQPGPEKPGPPSQTLVVEHTGR